MASPYSLESKMNKVPIESFAKPEGVCPIRGGPFTTVRRKQLCGG